MNNLEETTGVDKGVWIALIPALLSFFGWILKPYLDKKYEKKTRTENLALETYRELNKVVRDYEKEVALLYANVAKFEVGDIDEKQYEENYYQISEHKIPDLIRSIIGLVVFVPEIEVTHNIVRTQYNILSSMIYYKYRNINDFATDFNTEEDSEEEKIAVEKLIDFYLSDSNSAIIENYLAHEALVDSLLKKIQTNIKKINK